MKTKQRKFKRWSVKCEENRGKALCPGRHVSDVFQVGSRDQVCHTMLKDQVR